MYSVDRFKARVIMLGLVMVSAGFNAKSFAQPPAKPRPIERGVRYLLSQQHQDGLWRSESYGNLKEGAGVTALALYAISQTDPRYWKSHRQKLQKGIDLLAANIDKHGYVANASGPDYSNYGTALLLLATRHPLLKLKDKHRVQLIEYLIRAQLDEAEGYDQESLNFGGWDLSGWMDGKRPTTGTNISVTATVLEALAKEYAALNDIGSARTEEQARRLAKLESCFQRARAWIVKCGNEDGGFFFHPEKEHPGNKAEWSDQENRKPNSYGSATADGFLCMSYLTPSAPRKKKGKEPGQDYWASRMAKTAKWIGSQGKPDHVPGFNDVGNDSSWAHGLKYYYWMALAKSAAPRSRTGRGNDPISSERELPKWIEAEQNQNGSWQNKNARMREDDPLIATSFAVIALSHGGSYDVRRKGN